MTDTRFREGGISNSLAVCMVKNNNHPDFIRTIALYITPRYYATHVSTDVIILSPSYPIRNPATSQQFPPST